MSRSTTARRTRYGSLSRVLATGASAMTLIVGLALASSGAASGASISPHATSSAPCAVSIAAGSGVVDGQLILGAVAGSTQVKLDCNITSQAALAIEASLYTSISSSNVVPTGEVDTSALAQFAAAPTDTGCPAGVAGACETSTVAVPATYSAADPKATCPPTQAEVNAGVFGCAIAAITSSDTPVIGAEFLVQYASQTTMPNAPTISALQSTGAAGSKINVSDQAGATGYWWGDAVQAVQANALGVAAQVAPTTCGPGGGYGSVPSALLNVLWYASGSTTPIEGSAAGVTISNDCYTGNQLNPPVLSGTIPVPASVTSGTTYEVYLCELNLTPYQSTTTGPCGPTVSGKNWIEASFAFSAKAGVISQNLPVAASAKEAASSSFTAQLVTSGNTGAVTYAQTSGSPNLMVSSSGAITTSGKLKPGTYSASGTTSDTNGDTGTFTFSLKVAGPPPTPVVPRAFRVVGAAVVGRTTVVTIIGSGFSPVAKIFASAGVSVTVLRVASSRLIVRVHAILHARRGIFVLRIRFRDGKQAAVHYRVR
ncbi:MAG: hypothetical protein ACYCPT_08190 [Acidimicrobiales bacterium]